jgi:hypothetical protein
MQNSELLKLAAIATTPQYIPATDYPHLLSERSEKFASAFIKFFLFGHKGCLNEQAAGGSPTPSLFSHPKTI